MANFFQKFRKEIKNNPRLEVELYLLLILAILFAYFLFNAGKDSDQTPEDIPVGEESIEAELSEGTPAATEDPTSESDTQDVEIEKDATIYGLTINADVNLPNKDSLARVILYSDDGTKYLVYEAYYLLNGQGEFSVQEKCEETCLLGETKIASLEVYTENGAGLEVTKVNMNQSEATAAEAAQIEQKKEDVLDEKIAELNDSIEEKGYDWQAGRTAFGELSYEEKSQLYSEELPNFQGAEFYVGGVLEVVVDESSGRTPTTRPMLVSIITNLPETVLGLFASATRSMNGDVKGASIYASSWDWRTVHGANNPASPYFDGNPDSNETGNGWITAVKNQASCGSCWAFAAVGATESLANLYYNKHVNLDLSEQDMLSCSGAGSCSGGWPSLTLDYIKNNGVVNESCFSYSARDLSCSLKCASPSERIKISGRVDFTNKTEDNLKKLIIEQGPVSGGIYSWSHAMVLVGWYTDSYDEPVWIFKNSWGNTWGNHGYVNLKTPITNFGWTHGLILPIVDANSRSIDCLDRDGDGYYNWGLSLNKPVTCPSGIPDNKDCNDFNAGVSTYNEKYECIASPEEVRASSSLVNFSALLSGRQTATREISITNQTAQEMEIAGISLLDSSNFSLDTNPEGASNPCGSSTPTIAAGESCSVEVGFIPTSVRTYNTFLVVSYGAGGTSQLSIRVSGEGSTAPGVICGYYGGSFVAVENKCFSIEESECDEYNGDFNDCDFYCPPGMTCTEGCQESCTY
ncbi:hypothetical protein JW978_04065 [Candidatus Dojkabacteria bacterium]|nr:hypothetical protein [Candidatus Dojkabacteria bacterium]